MTNVILITYSEIALKGANRADFESALVSNILRATGSPKNALTKTRGRLYLAVPEENARDAMRSLSFVFGVHSFVWAQKVSQSEDEIQKAVRDVLKENSGTTFKIDAHRADKTFALSSEEINRVMGEAMLKEFPERIVRMKNPDETVVVEVREEGVYVYGVSQRGRGPGGFPVGTGGHALALLSGGIDSPVAAWRIMKRGIVVDAVYFHSPPFTGEKSREKVLDIARVLARWRLGPMRVFVVPFTDIQKAITSTAPEEYWIILFRRSMHRISERIAVREKISALVTGDSVAQVASQTLANLAAINAASTMLVLRPLSGMDKQETIELAKQIGTYDISIQPYEDCCTLFTPKRPKTKSISQKLEDIEKTLDLAPLEETAVLEAEVESAR